MTTYLKPGEGLPASTRMEYTPGLQPLGKQWRQMGDITYLLHRWSVGDRQAEEELFRLVMPNLHRVARYLMKGERKGHTLQSWGLVSEAYFKLAKDRDWQNRGHFFAFAPYASKSDFEYGRRHTKVPFVAIDNMENWLPADSAKLEQALTVAKLLNELKDSKPVWCRLVELKYFLGLTDEETADTLGMKLRTMQRMWNDVRLWLFERMGKGPN